MSGELKDREPTGVLRRPTRRTGSFYYRTTLPGIDLDRVEAKLTDGVLAVHLSKAEQSKPRQITIH